MPAPGARMACSAAPPQCGVSMPHIPTPPQSSASLQKARHGDCSTATWRKATNRLVPIQGLSRSSRVVEQHMQRKERQVQEKALQALRGKDCQDATEQQAREWEHGPAQGASPREFLTADKAHTSEIKETRRQHTDGGRKLGSCRTACSSVSRIKRW